MDNHNYAVMTRLENSFCILAIVHGAELQGHLSMRIERSHWNEIAVRFKIREQEVFALGCTLIESEEAPAHFRVYNLMNCGDMCKPCNWELSRTIYEIATAVFKLCADTVKREKYETSMFDNWGLTNSTGRYILNTP